MTDSDFSAFIANWSASTKNWNADNYEHSPYSAHSFWENVVWLESSTIQTTAYPFLTLDDFKSSTISNWRSPVALQASDVVVTNNAAFGSEVLNSQKTIARIPTSESAQNILSTVPSVEVIAEWDGYVERIYSDYFVASMQGLRGVGVVDKEEDAEIPISDVDSEDRDLLVEGGFFRLMIAYEAPRVGPRKRYTTVQFRRLPAYTKREIDAAEKEADELVNAFQLEESNRSAGA